MSASSVTSEQWPST